MDSTAETDLLSAPFAPDLCAAEDLLESSVLLARVAQFQCRRCLYLTPSGTLIDRRRRCPHCKQAGERRLFPSPALLGACDLVRSVFVTAQRQRAYQHRAGARAFRRRFPGAPADSAIAALAGRVQAAASGEPGAEMPSVLLLEITRELGLPHEAAAQAAYGQLLLFSDSVRTDGLVVLLADAVLQGLVREVLIARLLAAGLSEAAATTRLAGVQGLTALERAFAEITRRSLRGELDDAAEGPFAADWWTLHARSTAGAGQPITAAEAETAFRLVAESAAVIAALANAVVVGQKPFHPRRARG
ncbi:MAG TPA: hypothetical protein VH916_02075 [Dehalococcoidia bacterium]